MMPKDFRGQFELPISREPTPDRNHEMGGRSFYFFDFDDNVAFLSTPIFVYHKETKREVRLSSGEFAQVSKVLGKSGAFRDYQLNLDDRAGSFRCFRDIDLTWIEKNLFKKRQVFISDLASALGFPDFEWKGPSWSCFFHAALNQRPISVITARGHHPSTIQEGIELFVSRGHLPKAPNYLGIFPVSHTPTRHTLGDTDLSQTVAQLKKSAIRASVERAIELYGENPHHRFGMSDDDPHNIELIADEMMRLKTRFPQMSFFVIETQQGRFVKWEVFSDHKEAMLCAAKPEMLSAFEQLSLFPGSK